MAATVMIQHIRPGGRFKLACDPSVHGTVLRTSDCSTSVAVSGGVKDVCIESPDGSTRSFRAESKRTTNWSPNTEVYPIDASEVGFAERDGQDGYAPRSEMTLEQTQKLEAIRAKKIEHELKHGNGKPPRGRPHEQVKPLKSSTPDPKPKKMSALDAVEKVLLETGKPLTAKELVELMASKKYWASPSSKAPHLSVQSAILHDIAKPAKGSRFARADGGGFTLSVL